MYQKGGFKFTKFISNSREVLRTNPLEKLKDQDLNTSPVERAKIGAGEGERAKIGPGEDWNVENDYLGFKINL